MKKFLTIIFGLMFTIPGWTASKCNLWDVSSATEQTLKGVTYHPNADGTITVSGTSEGYAAYQLPVFTVPESLQGKTITIGNMSEAQGIAWSGIVLKDANNQELGNIPEAQNTSIAYATITLDPNVKYIEAGIKRKTDGVLISDVFKPIIVEGSSATPYTPYNANCFTCEGNFVQSHNLTQKVINQTITGNGTSESAFSININDITYKPNTQYTITLDVEAHDITYSQSGNLLWWNIQYTDDSYTYAGITTHNYMNPRVSVVTSADKTVKAINGPSAHLRWTGGTLKVSNLQIEEGTTATPYIPYGETACIPIIKIATTKYNNAAFSSVVTALNNAVDTIKTVVSNTINQATAVANLQSGKQTKPTDTCPNGKICLLVEDEAGTPYWYEIIERAPGIVPAGSGYTQVEYLQSSGTQYIDTGVTDSVMKWDIVAQRTDESGGQMLLWGYGSSLGLYISNMETGGWNIRTSQLDGSKMDKVKLTHDRITGNVVDFYIDDVLKDHVTNCAPASGSAYLFRANNTSGMMFTGRVYSAQAYKDGSLVVDFVPARRNSDGVLGMYDTVSGNFFTNQGSGEFYAPGDRTLPAGYTKLQYLQSSGDAYIDTGVTLTSNYERVVAKFSAEEAFSGYGWRIFGSQNGSGCSFVPWPVNDNTNPLGYLAVGKSWYLPRAQNDAISTSLYTPYEMDVTANNGNVSGTYCGYEFSSTYTGTVGNGLKVTLFKNNGQAGSGSGGRIYYFKMWTAANTLAFDGVPAKNSNNEYGIYDFVSQEFKRNVAGVGSFTGPLVQ